MSTSTIATRRRIDAISLDLSTLFTLSGPVPDWPKPPRSIQKENYLFYELEEKE